MNRLRTLLLAASLLVPACAWADPTVIFVSRHAEKGTNGNDPDLTAQGQLRAHNLAATLRKAGITHIFSTDTHRTRQTAQPLAGALGLPIQSYDAKQPAALVQQLKALGGISLVIGHSNTVPGLVKALGGEPHGEIDEATEFDRLYEITLGDDGKVSTLMLASLPPRP
ncbi:MAG: histidine phosphatase family protein [Pseudomonadota bacterium]